MSSDSQIPDGRRKTGPLRCRSRWCQIVSAAAMMGVVGTYQYVWSSIQGPLAADLDVAIPALAGVFTVYVVLQSLSQFPAGWWRDRHGPRPLLVLAALLAGGGYVGLAYATVLWQVYVLYSLGSIGVGIVYTVAVNTAVKWFPDRRGLTTGVGTMAFAAGSAALVPYVRANATVGAYEDVLLSVGAVILVVLLGGAVVLRDPQADEVPGSIGEPERASEDEWAGTDQRGEADRTPASDERAYSWREMVRTWQFWLLYGTFVLISGADLLVISQVVDFAEQLGFVAVVATISATLVPLSSGLSRLVLGGLSDRYGRTTVMAVSFVLAGLFRFGMVAAGLEGGEALFVLTVVLAMFFSSPLYVFFPSIVGDYYGRAYSSENYALLYTAKIGGGLIGGALAGVLVVQFGWTVTFAFAGAIAILAGLGAVVLRPPKPRRASG